MFRVVITETDILLSGNTLDVMFSGKNWGCLYFGNKEKCFV